MNKKRIITFLTLACLLSNIIVLPTLALKNIETSTHKIKENMSFAEYKPHSQIFINNNKKFTKENGVKQGDGTKNNPYLIEGWEIIIKENVDEDFCVPIGICIISTNDYFEIKNCYIHDGKGYSERWSVGIFCKNVTNGGITSVVSVRNSYGIQLTECGDITISCCNCSNNAEGISISETMGRIWIHNNNIMNNYQIGIEILEIESEGTVFVFVFYNNICKNGQGILCGTSSNVFLRVFASFNWWGSMMGPSWRSFHRRGDSIKSGDNSLVVFIPWSVQMNSVY
jgi:hypothetical protein